MLHKRPLVFELSFDLTPRINYIGEHHGRATEYVILELHACIKRNVVLDFDVVSYLHIRCHMYILSQNAISTDLGMRHDVRKVPDPSPLPDFSRLIHNGGGMNKTPRALGFQLNGISLMF